MFGISPLAPGQFEAAWALIRTVYPTRSDPIIAQSHQDDRWAPHAGPNSWVVLHRPSQQVVGFGSFWRVRLTKYRLDLLVHPDWRLRGIGSLLLDHLLQGLNALGATTVQARVDAAEEASLTFLTHRGFSETQRMVELHLTLSEAALLRWDALASDLAAQGIAFRSLATAQETDPACWRKLADLHNAALPDWPDPDPGPVELVSPPAFQRQLAGWSVIFDAFFIAIHDEQFVGYSGLADPYPGQVVVESAGTAVRPEYRGRHIATALKVACLAAARQRGFGSAVTRSANPAMVRVNEKLGFQRGPVEVRLVRAMP
jgi:GNAT superfamily N-acetyltransferase